MDWHDRITLDTEILLGKPVIRGTRIAVEFVIDLLARGYRAEDVIEQYEFLSLEDIQACLAYAGDALRSERVYAIPA
ncbi:MAG: DUF433 domain-containing protein [Thermoanaerobaculia bacterium]|nr:DUF433 domain-containing protein [Thermoanaerobaculia bacterium]